MIAWLLLQAAAHDSVTVQAPPPLPGGPAAVARFLLNTVPQWLQVAGVFIAAAVVIALAWMAITHRHAVVAWIRARSVAWKVGAGSVLVAGFAVAGFAGLKTWNFMMHDNDFCSGCHVMNSPFQKFGNVENKHAKLLCHDCHQQSIFASMKELYVWVSDRPEKIPSHPNNVPNKVCAQCHVQRDADSTWKRVVATAGHQVHLNGKSPLFKELECIVCHAQEVHRFKPGDRTCGQSGCHDQVRIQLGKMANQTDLHCVTCHGFTANAAESQPVDSARVRLTPGEKQCLGCHEMREKMAHFEADSEPHNAVCGTCHNPHTQTTTFGAYQSCATAGCHVKADTLTAMHRGLKGHALDNCGACHVAHTWKARATDCKSCHSDIDRDRTATPRGRVRRAFGEGRRRGTWLFRAASLTPGRRAGARRSASRASPAGRDTLPFSHRRHASVSCTTCHTSDDVHGAITISRPDACTACHHKANNERPCSACHAADRPAALRASPSLVSMQLAVGRAPRVRTLGFTHRAHASRACKDCHRDDARRSVQTDCLSCHADHHDASRSCEGCHERPTVTHVRDVHLTGCAGSECHRPATAALLIPGRQACLVCHRDQATHKPRGDCASCHLAHWPVAS